MPKRRKSKRRAQILQPTVEGPCKYSWPQVRLGESKQVGGATGVFAGPDGLHAGDLFPFVGRIISEKEVADRRADYSLTHGYIYEYQGSKGGPAVDGHPNHHPYNQVGGFGLCIAMMVNEPTTLKPNCVFKRDHLLVAKHIKSGDELLVWYGNGYDEIRKHMGYSLDTNRYLNNAHPLIHDIQWPTYAERDENTRKLNRIIKQCHKIKYKLKSILNP
jgi:hypothetical protein